MTIRFGIGSTGLAFLFSFLILGAGIAQEGTDRDQAREEITGLIEAGEWKAAGKALKVFKKEHGKTPEGKEEYSRLEDLLEGSEDLQKIQDEYRKKSKPRTAAVKLQKIIENNAHLPDLVEKTKKLLEVVRSEYVLVLEDFEGLELKKEEEPKEEDVRRLLLLTQGLSVISDPKFVKHGEHAGRWNAKSTSRSFSFPAPQQDLRQYAFFCAWIFNEKMEKRPGQVRIDAMTDFDHYYTYLLALDWVGWKEIRMPLQGRGSKFSRQGMPDWGSIETFSFYREWENPSPVNIIVDDIRLEKAVK